MISYVITLAGFGPIVLLISNFTIVALEYSESSYVHVYTSPESSNQDYKIIKCSVHLECSKLAEAIVYEARGETEANQLKVASVILNRVHHKNFPDSVIDVIEQPYQFSYLSDMHKQNDPPQTAWDKGYAAAYDVFFNGIRSTEALFYLNPAKVKNLPKWAKVYTRIEIAENHHFYTY